MWHIGTAVTPSVVLCSLGKIEDFKAASIDMCSFISEKIFTILQ